MKRNVDIDYVWPHETYAVVDGKRHNFSFQGPRKSKAHSQPRVPNPFILSDKKLVSPSSPLSPTVPSSSVDQAFEQLDVKKEQKITKAAALEFAVAASVPKETLSKVNLKPYLTKTDFAEFVKSLDIPAEQIEKVVKAKAGH